VTEITVLNRRYLALFLPFLSSEREKRSGTIEEPFALVEKIRSALRIVAVDAAAAALGISPGLMLADARARVPELIACSHDSAADLALLAWLADGCDRYTPMVALDPPQGLLLDITGCTHLFKQGETGLIRDVSERIMRLGLTLQSACAETPDAARALAQFGGGNTRALPVTALRVAAETHVALHRAGLRVIGDLADRPRAPLAARFGAEIVALLARILGEEDVHITPRRPTPALSFEARFAEPVARTDDILSTLDELTTKAALTLSERACGGRQFEATLFRSDGHVARLGIETGGPAREPARLIRLFRERIDSLNDPLDPGFGYDLIRLDVPVIEHLASEQLQLEGGVVTQAEITALVDRLGVRLGRNRLRHLVPGDSHIPEQTVFELPAIETSSPSLWPAAEPGEPPSRPLHLFEPPQRIEVLAAVPDGPPRRFRWRRTMHDIRLYEGPERIAAEWWKRRDNAGLTRDYYRVEDVRGRRFWLFRHGLYGTEKVNPDWYLHGLFA
jgi:protein ImuB